MVLSYSFRAWIFRARLSFIFCSFSVRIDISRWILALSSSSYDERVRLIHVCCDYLYDGFVELFTFVAKVLDTLDELVVEIGRSTGH